jgi:hypothetical protein
MRNKPKDIEMNNLNERGQGTVPLCNFSLFHLNNSVDGEERKNDQGYSNVNSGNDDGEKESAVDRIKARMKDIWEDMSPQARASTLVTSFCCFLIFLTVISSL